MDVVWERKEYFNKTLRNCENGDVVQLKKYPGYGPFFLWLDATSTTLRGEFFFLTLVIISLLFSMRTNTLKSYRQSFTFSKEK